MSFTGFLQVGIELGMDAILVKPKRQIGSFVAQVTIKEEHHDSLVLTEHPVEQGAAITDHAYKRPAQLIVTAGWSNTPSSNAVGSSSSVLGSLAGALTGTIGGVVDLTQQAGASFDGISSAVGQLSDTVTQPLSTAKEYASGALNKITDGVSGDVTGFISNVPGGIAGAFGAGDLLGGVPSLSDVGGGLADAAGDLFGDISGGLGSLSSSLSGANVGQVNDVYAKFLELQQSRIPFDVFTGKRAYQDMLIVSLATTTTKETENALVMTIHMQQVLIVANVTSQTVTSDQSAQSDPEDTAPTLDEGDAQLGEAENYNEDAGNESIDADPAGETFA